MGEHLIYGEFQSDKYPTTPRGKVPLSCRDTTAQDLLWEYAQRRRLVDAEFAADLEEALRLAGFKPGPQGRPRREWRATHRHYRGEDYRLLDTVWREQDGVLLFRYEHRDGRRWARPAGEFVAMVKTGETAMMRRFMPLFGHMRAIPHHRTASGFDARITLHEYMLLANAEMIAGGAPLPLVLTYRHDQWIDAWREGTPPNVAAAGELEEVRAA